MIDLAETYARRDRLLAVAPMMDWTDRHCRFFHRLLTRRTLLYTEMVVAEAAIHGPRDRLLARGADGPMAVQLGGSDPVKLAEAARIAIGYGYDEVNLNVGCPSDRVQSGAFGACLMREPDLVARCTEAMSGAVDVPVTVKCRIGVDDQDPGPALDRLHDLCVDAGASAFWVHARKAWLQGLSPKENRDIPPLDYGRVHALHGRANRFVGINGGLADTDAITDQLGRTDGVMVGRAAYHDPMILTAFDGLLGSTGDHLDLDDTIEAMVEYAAVHRAAGGRVSHVTRHMIGLFNGMPGARQWRRALSERTPPEAEANVIADIYAELRPVLFGELAA